MIQVKFTSLHPQARVPEYKSSEAAGADIYACLTEPITISPFGIVLIPTGLAFEIPSGYQGEVRARSGLAYREGLFVLNGPGTIDADYRGELKIILANFSAESKMIHPFDRIAQLVIMPVVRAEFVKADLAESSRQTDGFGSTGKR